MHQLKLDGIIIEKPVVNVASVPHRSPFRYPGGKTWLIPHIRCWLDRFGEKPEYFIEPFTGGGIVGLTVAFERLAEKVILVELDDSVASVWRTMLQGDADWLADRILNFEIITDNVIEELSKTGGSEREMAFRTLLRNRASHGGIMAPGAGLIKTGESGRGVGSRWYADTLARRIRDIGRVSDRVEFIHGDGIRLMAEYAKNPNAVFFIDPPYTASTKRAGTRLYKHNTLNHEALFNVAQTIDGDFLMTYDDDVVIKEMAEHHRFDFTTVPMKNTHHTVMTELLIGQNLDWAR